MVRNFVKDMRDVCSFCAFYSPICCFMYIYRVLTCHSRRVR
jgi:hypothetical protein